MRSVRLNESTWITMLSKFSIATPQSGKRRARPHLRDATSAPQSKTPLLDQGPAARYLALEPDQSLQTKVDSSESINVSRCIVALNIALVTGLALAAAPASAKPAKRTHAAAPWCRAWQRQSLAADAWDVAYDGHGAVRFDDGIRLTPKTAESVDKTHAALALLRDSPKSKRYAVRVRYETLRPLRGPASNPWETLWLFFDYKPDPKGKRTNYVIHKPNGMEIGRAWNEIDQDFIATSSAPIAKVKTSYELTLVRDESGARAYIDGKLALKTNPTKVLESSGSIGLYVEDSDVRISSFELCEPRQRRVFGGALAQSR